MSDKTCGARRSLPSGVEDIAWHTIVDLPSIDPGRHPSQVAAPS